MFRRLIVCVFACLLLAGATDAAPRYKVVILTPSGFIGAGAVGGSGGLQVGWGTPAGGTTCALLWSGTAESYVNLHPTGYVRSVANGVDAGQQVGEISPDMYHTYAALWSGTAQSFVDLHPSAFLSSVANGVYAGQQVGAGYLWVELSGYATRVCHALLWSGTAGSCIDLNPSGFEQSYASAISEGQIVGFGRIYVHTAGHALLWSTTAGSCIDLNPNGFFYSQAHGVSGGQQVGVGLASTSVGFHALLWSGTARSCVDLNPSGFGESCAYATSGDHQVGYGSGVITGGVKHALVWSGTPESYLDLHSFLPPGYAGESYAWGIDSAGNIVGHALYSGLAHAVMWVPLPPVVPPVVSTSPATDVTKTSATLNGILTDDGGEACQYRFRYKEAKGSYIYTSWYGSVTSGDSFSEPVGGLKSNATYYFNAQAKNSAGESAWGNEQSFVADSVDFEISRVRMVSPNELGIDIRVRFPRGFPEASPRKVDFWANVNGTDVRVTCDISSFVGPGETANIRCVINFESKGVPRFEDNMAFTLYGVAYWEGGQYSYAYSIPVEIPLPVIIIHGYVYTHEAGGWFLDKVKFVAYNDLMDFLAENGYTTDPSWYRTMWGPIDCQYEADKVTELGIYSDVDFWVQRALEKEDGTPRTYANKVDIIGHSTGGLVARYYAGGASTVNKVISIGTPHLGLTQFYQFAFDYSSKEQADKLFRVNPREPASEENLLRWFEPEYGESSLVDAWGVPVAEPYENNFDAAYNPNVDYLSIYANHRTDTPYKLVVNRTKKGWYEILDVLGGNGDGTVPELSGSGFSPDDLGPITSGVHQFLCEEPEVQKRVLNFLSGR